MVMSEVKDEIFQLIEAYFSAQTGFSGEKMLEFWYPTGKMFLVGNRNVIRVVTVEEQTQHMKKVKVRMPDLAVDFVIDEIEQVAVHDDLIASVHVRYRMVFPEGYGKHRCFFNLAKIDGQWKIVNVVDRGFEVLPDSKSN
jgi:hypothetical protein